MDWKILETAPRILMNAALQPAQGNRFQPTGFADLGAAQYTLPQKSGGTEMLLVESAQSVANRLEKTALQGDGPDIDPDFAGLPYVIASLTGADVPVRTSSLVEAHRIGSPYFLLNKTFSDKIRSEMGYNPKRPLDWKKIYATLFKYDPNSLLHGVFLSLLEGGRVRAPRAITGFIEAENVEKVISGGVKNSPVDPKGELQVAEAEASEKGVYSNVPYSRIEYTAHKITAFFNVDVALIRGYGLPESAMKLLISLGLVKVRRFLTSHLRLRTACDLAMIGDINVTAPTGFIVPAEKELFDLVRAGIEECKSLFADPPLTQLETPVKIVKKKDDPAATT